MTCIAVSEAMTFVQLFMETDPKSFEDLKLLTTQRCHGINFVQTNCILNGVENKLKRAGADFTKRCWTFTLNPVALFGGFDQLLKNYRRPVMNVCTVEEFDKFVSLKPSSSRFG